LEAQSHLNERGKPLCRRRDRADAGVVRARRSGDDHFSFYSRAIRCASAI
jgi:hypothetical protein